MTDSYGASIFPEHAARLAASRITVEVARARQYVTADTAAQLHRYGHQGAVSSWCPALVMPEWVHDGTIAHYQVRPANPLPAPTPRGKPRKYTYPVGVENRLGVHPFVIDAVADPTVDVWLTEGLFKGDAILSAGAKVFTLAGVWSFLHRDEDEQSVVIDDFEAIAWEGRTVFLAFDHDVTTSPKVHAGVSRLWRELKSRGARPMFVRVPMIRADGHTGIDDWLAAFPDEEGADLLEQLVDEAESRLPPKPDDRPPVLETEHPRVDVSGARPVTIVAAEMAKQIATADDAHEVYSHGGIMSRLDVVEGRAQLRPVDAGMLHWIVGDACDPVLLDRNGAIKKHVPTPPVVANMLMTMRGPWPAVDGLTATPFLRQDGTIVSEPGYDWLSRMVYRPMPGFSPPAVNGDVRGAVGVLDDALHDFGFEDATSRANAFGLILTPFLRPLIGLVPLFVIDSPTPGSGKGLLVSLASIIATGQPCGTWPYPTDYEESRKLFTTILSTGAAIVHLDEAHAVGGVHLANLLTSDEWHDRLIGTGRAVAFPNRTVWCAAGNNVEVRGDLARRVCVIRLDPRMEDPAGRPGTAFRHHPLGPWAVRQRGPLVSAALALCRAWVDAGRPSGDVTVGSFEEWGAIVGGVLAVAHVDGFMGNRQRVLSHADVERASSESFVRWLHVHYGDAPFTVAEIVVQLRAAVVDPPESVGIPEHPEIGKRMGGWFRRNRGRRYGRHAIIDAGTDSHTGRVRWAVETEGPEDWPW